MISLPKLGLRSTLLGGIQTFWYWTFLEVLYTYSYTYTAQFITCLPVRRLSPVYNFQKKTMILQARSQTNLECNSRKCVTVPKNSKFLVFMCRKCVTVPKNPKNPKIKTNIVAVQVSHESCAVIIFAWSFGFLGFFGTVTHFLHIQIKNFEFFGTVTHFRDMKGNVSAAAHRPQEILIEFHSNSNPPLFVQNLMESERECV